MIATAAFLVASALCLVEPAKAFDTGHHSDLSRIVLKQQGFSPDAVNAVRLASWLNDYHSNAPTGNLLFKLALKRLHFDNLRTPKEVENYYHQLLVNLRALTHEAVEAKNKPAMLIILGIAQHVIQDFYAHSNWAELYKRAPDGRFKIELFPIKRSPSSRALRTGTWPGDGRFGHGGYDRGMNKDSINRPYWENAFVMAHMATIRITRQIQQWVKNQSPGFWDELKQYQASESERRSVNRDLKSAQDISMWVKASVLGLPAFDGHWKGNHSGHTGKFSAANQAFTTRKNSAIAQQFRETGISSRLALNLKKPPRHKRLTALPELNDNLSKRRVIVVKIDSYQLVPRRTNSLSIGARININGETYLGRIFSRRSDFNSETAPAWHEVHITREGEEAATVSIELFAQLDDENATEVPIDINPAPDKTALTFETSENDSVTNNSTETFTTQGDAASSAKIRYSVEVYNIE